METAGREGKEDPSDNGVSTRTVLLPPVETGGLPRYARPGGGGGEGEGRGNPSPRFYMVRPLTGPPINTPMYDGLLQRQI